MNTADKRKALIPYKQKQTPLYPRRDKKALYMHTYSYLPGFPPAGFGTFPVFRTITEFQGLPGFIGPVPLPLLIRKYKI
jgi:hypothetical protein